jgi:mono/diheme cytochrome c family protein
MRLESSVIPVLTLLLCVGTVASTPNSDPRSSSTKVNSNNLIERGKYIVDGLSRCGQCHTPKDDVGNPIPSKSLDGAPLWLQSARPVQNWPLKAPRIAGDVPGTDAEMIRLLTTGIWRDGRPLRAPMPQFRMTREDAEAVVAYLKSLTPKPQ